MKKKCFKEWLRKLKKYNKIDEETKKTVSEIITHTFDGL